MIQEQLAQCSGVSFTTINRLENKGGAAEFSTIKKLADALSASTADLMAQPETEG